MAVVGPMWTGPLHCAAFVEQLGDESTRHAWAQGLAEGYGRRPSGESYRPKGISSYSFRDLDDLLALMREEAQTELPPYLLKVDDVSVMWQWLLLITFSMVPWKGGTSH